MKSTVKRIKEIETSKELEITKLFADKAALEAHRQKLQTMFKNETQEQINVKINNLIARDNAFNAAMNEIVKCYEVNIDQTEWDNAFNNLKTKYPTHKEEFLRNLSKHTIIKTLIFQDLAQL
jgi:DNA-binding SARP family transcriptional activator